MTDRHSGYVVVLDEDIREDDAAPILNAIKLIKHVKDVQPVVSDPGSFIVAHREKLDLLEGLREWLVEQYKK